MEPTNSCNASTSSTAPSEHDSQETENHAPQKNNSETNDQASEFEGFPYFEEPSETGLDGEGESRRKAPDGSTTQNAEAKALTDRVHSCLNLEMPLSASDLVDLDLESNSHKEAFLRRRFPKGSAERSFLIHRSSNGDSFLLYFRPALSRRFFRPRRK